MAVVAKDVGKHAKEKRILSHVGFETREGEIFGVLGPNASGKTTLLRIVSTMLLPDEGYCEVFGMDVTERERAVRRLLGYVSPDCNFHDRLTASEIAMFYRRIANVDIEKVRGVLKECGVLSIWDKRWAYLSYGERVILLFSIAIGRNPKLLILDEPTANLDVANKAIVSDLLVEERITSLVATHDMGFAKKTIGRCIVLNEGNVALSGEIDSLVKKLRFKTSVEGKFHSCQDDKLLNSLGFSYRRKEGSFDVTFYVETADEKLDLMREITKLKDLTGISVSEPSVEDLIFWVKSKNAKVK